MKFFRLLVLGLLVFNLTYAKDTKIIVITHGSNTDGFWNVVKNGVEQAKKDSGADVDYRNPSTGDLTEMARLINTAVSQKPDGLIVSIPDATALSKSIKRAVNAGIPVISINSGADISAKLGAIMHIGQPEYEAGLGAGKRAKAEGVGTNFLCVNHEIFNSALEDRCRGFADGLGAKNVMLDSSVDPSEIQKKVAAKLKTNNYDAICFFCEKHLLHSCLKL